MRAAVPTPRRLLILSHGVGGNETDLAPLAARASADTAVLLVRGPLRIGADLHAWFPVTFGRDGPRPDLAAAEDSRQRFARFVEEVQLAYDVGPECTVLAGFSQGGIISASVALTRPELVAGFGVLAGRILPELESRLADTDALRHVHAFVGHGEDDTKLPVGWAFRAKAWLTELGLSNELRLYPGDHGVPTAMQEDFIAWFGRVTDDAGRMPLDAMVPSGPG